MFNGFFTICADYRLFFWRLISVHTLMDADILLHLLNSKDRLLLFVEPISWRDDVYGSRYEQLKVDTQHGYISLNNTL